MNNTLKNERIEVVDALRGVALFAIVILHCFEHYNLYYMPDCQPHWLTALDKGVWDTVWFLFGGKAFSTFSLLFGQICVENDSFDAFFSASFLIL